MPLWVTPGRPKVAFLCITPVPLVYEANCCLYVIEVSTVFQCGSYCFSLGYIFCSERNYSDLNSIAS